MNQRKKVYILDLVGRRYAYWAHPGEAIEEHEEKCMRYAKRLVLQKGLKQMYSFYIDGFNLMDKKSEPYQVIKKFIQNAVEDTIAFHDIGKINPMYQKKLKNPSFSKVQISNGIGSRHSIISAVLYLDYYLKTLKNISEEMEMPKEQLHMLCYLLYLNSYLISRHHSNLSDFQEYMQEYDIRNGKIKDRIEEIRKDILPICKTDYPFLESNIVLKWARKCKRKTVDTEKNICMYIYHRLLLSILLAADYYATSEQTTGVIIDSAGILKECEAFRKAYEDGSINQEIRAYEKKQYHNGKNEMSQIKSLNALRCELFLDAEHELLERIDEKMFYLEAPTGIGKSNTALNLSFWLMKGKKELNKLFYIYPFNTLVEQNESILTNLFQEEEHLLAHIHVVNSLHSLMKSVKEEEEDKEYQKVLLDRQFLNYPVTLSTHVTLFDIMFGERKESVFSFHQLANSVIVLDEIQSYKNSIWTEIITFFHVFAKVLNIRFLIMSATLPDLSQLALTEQQPVKLIRNHDKYYKHSLIVNRSVAHYELLERECSMEKLAEYVIAAARKKKKILVEFITKKSAEHFYQYMKGSQEKICPIRLLTGDDNVAERKCILKELEASEAGEAFLLIATQVIEAGVDINNVEIGFKDYSILDAEEQFKGRINRSCDMEHVGTVYFFSLDRAQNVYRGDMRVEKELTIRNSLMQECLEKKEFQKYYKMVMERIREANGTSDEQQNISAFFEQTVCQLNAVSIAKRMRLIAEDEWKVNVFFNRKIVVEEKELIGSEIWKRFKAILQDQEMDYAKKQVKLSDVKVDMSYFMYPVNAKFVFAYDERNCEQIGEIYYIEKADVFFEDGRFQREKFEKQGQLII